MRKCKSHNNGHFTKHVIHWEFQWKSSKFIFIGKITRMIKTMQHKAFLKNLNKKLHTIYCELSKHHSKTWTTNPRPRDNAVRKTKLIADTQPKLICHHKDGTHIPSQRRNSLLVTKTELNNHHKDKFWDTNVT